MALSIALAKNKLISLNPAKKTGPPVETGRPNDCYTKIFEISYLLYSLLYFDEVMEFWCFTTPGHSLYFNSLTNIRCVRNVV